MMAVACDSIAPLLKDLVSTLRYVEEVLSFVGIYYIGKKIVFTLYEIVKGARIHVIPKIFAPKLTKKFGQWAVLAGVDCSIGEAFAAEFAKNGMNIMLMSHMLEDMQIIAQRISKEFGVETEVLKIDFCNGQPVYKSICEALSQKDIGILVNDCRKIKMNESTLENVSEDDLWAMVIANIGAIPAMTKTILPGMKARKRGAIVNMSSIEGCFLFPFRHLCPGTEAFVNSFLQSLSIECQYFGVSVQTLLIGPVKLSANKQQISSLISNIFRPTASTYAYHAVRTIGYTHHTTGYWVHGILVWLLQRIPESMLMWTYILAFNISHYQKID